MFSIVELSGEQADVIDSSLEDYDLGHIRRYLKGDINVGVVMDGKLVGGLVSCITTNGILYVSSVYVDETHRGRGVGTALMKAAEERAAALGVNLIRLDTFDWQGAGFYKKIGYEQVGRYDNDIDGYSEYFFIKRL